MSHRLLLKNRKFWHLVSRGELLSASYQPAKPAALHVCKQIYTSVIALAKQKEQVAMGEIQVRKGREDTVDRI